MEGRGMERSNEKDWEKRCELVMVCDLIETLAGNDNVELWPTITTFDVLGRIMRSAIEHFEERIEELETYEARVDAEDESPRKEGFLSPEGGPTNDYRMLIHAINCEHWDAAMMHIERLKEKAPDPDPALQAELDEVFDDQPQA
jgi:hypothetical protein